MKELVASLQLCHLNWNNCLDLHALELTLVAIPHFATLFHDCCGLHVCGAVGIRSLPSDHICTPPPPNAPGKCKESDGVSVFFKTTPYPYSTTYMQPTAVMEKCGITQSVVLLYFEWVDLTCMDQRALLYWPNSTESVLLSHTALNLCCLVIQQCYIAI